MYLKESRHPSPSEEKDSTHVREHERKPDSGEVDTLGTEEPRMTM